MPINKAFDELYHDYTAKILRWVPYYKNMVADIAQYLPADFQPNHILDLGCGNGNTTSYLLQNFPTAHYCLVDASAEMVAGCRERFQDQSAWEYHQSYFQDLQFPAERFDLIVACLAVHHLKPKEKADLFQQVQTWLRPNGRFICGDLMIEKSNLEFHERHLQQWKEDAFAQGTTAEEWQFLMDHYETYDFPSGLDVHLNFLETAGFSNINVAFRKIGWTAIVAMKPT